MKKLAYIILVIAILLLIGHFVKNDQSTAQEPVAQTPAVSEEATVALPSTEANNAVQNENASAQPEQNAPAEGSDVVEVQETSEDIIIEEGAPEDDGAVDVEETSDATMDEEETVLPE